jgi:amidase
MYRITRDHYQFTMDVNHKPALKVPRGSVVEFETHDCFTSQITHQGQTIDALDWQAINPATGPLFIEGAMPGDVLKIEILDIQVDDTGVMAAIPQAGLLGNRVRESGIKVLSIEGGAINFDDELFIPLSPMIGVIGVAPKSGPVPCGTPGPHGGNMDNKKIRKGAALYLQVNCEGALLSIGDLHAAMGDGEIMVSGVEVGGRVQVAVDVLKNLELRHPFLEDAAHYYTIASHENLMEAVRQAAGDMTERISTVYQMPYNEAGMLMSAVGNAQICQVVDPLLTVRFEVPKSVVKRELIGN